MACLPSMQPVKEKKPQSQALTSSTKKTLKVRQNASNRTPPFRPAAPVLMRLRPWRKFESKPPNLYLVSGILKGWSE